VGKLSVAVERLCGEYRFSFPQRFSTEGMRLSTVFPPHCPQKDNVALGGMMIPPQKEGEG